MNQIDHTYEIGSVRIVTKLHQVFKNDQPVHLREKTFEVLCFLIENRERAVPREAIKNAVWGENVAIEDTPINNIVVELRRLMGDDAIVTHRGFGYRFAADVKDLPGTTPSRQTGQHSEIVATSVAPMPSEPIEALKFDLSDLPHPIGRSAFSRYLLDRSLPTVHQWLCRAGALSFPPEYSSIKAYLQDVKGSTENDIARKNYIPLSARGIPRVPSLEDTETDAFVRPIHQIVRRLVKPSEGGDSVSAQLAVVNRRSRVVKNLVQGLLRAERPLILLGEPGSGKTLTMQQTTLALIHHELPRVYPEVPLLIRLGEFHCDGAVTTSEVTKFIKRSAPFAIRPLIDSLEYAGRLVIFFDGLDEMSRVRYTSHTEALSRFAAGRQGRTKTLFSCRITDFSPSFVHQRLVLLPFNRSQITEYLFRYFSARSIVIEGKNWKLKVLAKHLTVGIWSMDASNPFVLWLLCFHLARRQKWPTTRIELLNYYIEESYRRKAEAIESELAFPLLGQAMGDWAKFAYRITMRNAGSAIPVSELWADGSMTAAEVDLTVRTGRRCAVLAESTEAHPHLVRFEHHRLQEFFTARHIHCAKPEINWIDKLDAPRWQETLINLVLMGGEVEAIYVLQCVISGAIPGALSEPPKAAVTAMPYDQELLLADRVELAIRIVRERTDLPAQFTLMEVIPGAVDFLMARGNPTTQTKMMRSCLHLRDPRIVAAIRRPLTSGVRWLREQALILLSASEDRGMANLPTEIGYDLASEMLYLRLHSYLRAVRHSRQPGALWSLCIASVCVLLNVSILAFLLIFLYRQSIEFGMAFVGSGAALRLSPLRGFMTHGPAGPLTALLAMIVSFFVGRKAPENVWASAIVTTSAIPILTFLVPALWWTPGQALASLTVGVSFVFFVIAPLLTAIISASQSFTLACYLVATAPFRKSKGQFPSFFITLWRVHGFDWWIRWWFTPTPTGPSTSREDLAKGLAKTALGALALCILVGAVIWWAYVGAYLGKVAAIALVIFVVLAVISNSFGLLPWLRSLAYQPYPTRSYTESAWSDLVAAAEPEEQREILLRTNNDSLGLSTSEFVRVLLDIQSKIKEEPALSAYWAHRTELEQLLKQERRG